MKTTRKRRRRRSGRRRSSSSTTVKLTSQKQSSMVKDSTPSLPVIHFPYHTTIQSTQYTSTIHAHQTHRRANNSPPRPSPSECHPQHGPAPQIFIRAVSALTTSYRSFATQPSLLTPNMERRMANCPSTSSCWRGAWRTFSASASASSAEGQE